VELLEVIAARLVVGEQASEDLPGLATEALVRGLDSPSLREAAGLSPRDVRAAREAFVNALRELGLQLPDEQSALWLLIRNMLRRIVDGSINAYEGASWIWHQAYWRVEREGDLRVFVGLASEWDDHPGSRPAIEQAIRDSAVDLLAQGEPRSWLMLQARDREPPVRLPGKDQALVIEDLPFSEQLKSDLQEWANDFDKVKTRPGRGPSGFQSVSAAERFVDRGARLHDEIQRQLGDHWHVEYMPTQRAFPRGTP
jgi:hypothetical protein